MRSFRSVFSASALALLPMLLLAGCDDDDDTGNAGGGGTVVVPGGPVTTRYGLANACFALKSVQKNAFAVKGAGGAYAASAPTAAGGQAFFMKPTALGNYLFYAKDATLLAVSSGEVGSAAAPSNNTDWTVDLKSDGSFSITNSSAVRTLAVNPDTGALVLVMAATGDTGKFAFESTTGCVSYPEMPTGIDGPTYKANAIGTPVIGFAEVHAHMAMGSDMSDGTGTRGPSAGGVMYGHAVNRFGAPHALEDCASMHGDGGVLSPEWLILDGGDAANAQHDTQGWPTFVDWPKRDSLLHQQMYYKWVERVYKAGLRTMVIHGTNIEALCDIAKISGGNKDPDLLDEDCTDMGVGVKQVEYLFDMEKYIDAQEGGPGKGWFRIVKDPTEARTVIADGKMAVIPGLEFSNIFRCNVNFTPADAAKTPNEAGTSACTKADIDREIDEVWNLGVRAVFPYHDVDSSLGGTGIFSSILNYVGFFGTQGFWRTYPCENGGVGDTFFYDAGAVMESAPLNNPITAAVAAMTGGVTPLYPPGRQCNARDVTPLGLYAIKKIMQKGFTLDIDHAEIRSKQIMLDLVKNFATPYPMISGHGGHGGINNNQIKQMIKQGGIVYPSSRNGKEYKDFLNKLKPLWTASGTTRPLAIGYGADQNGLAGQPGSRGAAATRVVHPFTLFSGAGWGPQYSAAGIEPIVVKELSIKPADCAGCTGGKTWNMDTEGMSHYGMIADMVEEVRIEGGQEATDTLYRSAETYLQMWEQTLAASAEARVKLVP